MSRRAARAPAVRKRVARGPAKQTPTHYQILQVHPAAPLDLITAAYWRLVSQVHTAGRSDKAAEVAVYHLTRSYETLANPQSRMEYDRSIGLPEHPGIPKLPPHQRMTWVSSFLSGKVPATEPDPDVDYYEILRVDPIANPGIAAEAYLVMRNYYLRLVEQTGASRELVDRLVEGFDIISDAGKRREYDRSRKARRKASAKAADAGRSRPARPPAVEEPHVEDAPAAERRKASPRRLATANGHKPGIARQGHPIEARDVAEPVSIKLARTLASGLRLSSEQSIRFARMASRTLREALVEDNEEILPSVMNLTPEEEEALLERLSSVPEGAPSETKPPVSSSGLLAQLSIIDGPGQGRGFNVDTVPFTLGDDDSCDITLPGLAQQQARLLHRNGQFVLFSLTDEPKTTIHGNAVAWGVLEDGDAFQIGPYVFKFESPSLAVAER